MFKLRLDGTTVRVTDPFMHIDWDIHEEFKHSKLCLNMDAFFDKNRPDEILLYDLKMGRYSLPINRKVISLLSTVETVEYKFVNCLTDAPEDSQSVHEVEIQIDSIRTAINTYAEWCIYNMINYLPYADFAIDHMPTIDKVYINGKESDLFYKITAYIMEILNHAVTFDILKDGSYNTCQYNHRIEKDKRIYMSYYRVNSHYPIYYYTYKHYRKALKKLDHIEITLRWYEGKYDDSRDYSVYSESISDEYMYSDTTLESSLTLATVMPYLYQYYNHELKYMRDNHFLITIVTFYYRTKTGLSGFEIIDPNSKFVFENMMDSYCQCSILN